MTYSAEYQRQRKLEKKEGARERKTAAGVLLESLLVQIQRTTTLHFPSKKYQLDPVAFAREVLGVEPWSKQVEILEAVRDHKRVAVKSGHKVSKSHSAAIVALWFYCSFEDARVIMTSTTARQVDKILWRELRMLKARSGRCCACKAADLAPIPCEHSAVIDGVIGDLARTGLISEDFREIVGFTASEAEAVAGISGKNLLYIVDEASGVDDAIFEAIEGNRAGGARVVMFSNPTRTAGTFFEAFNASKRFWHCITISSEETPNVVEGRDIIPGLATREWVEEKKEEWGEDSALYKVRVKGEFATREDGKAFPLHTIETSEARWHDMPADPEGRLFLGLDPAGATGQGDESAFSLRRGYKQIALFVLRGLRAEGHLVHVLSTLARYKREGEVPVVVIDREGNIGAELFGSMRNFTEAHKGVFELVGLRASDKARRNPLIYDRMRDELAANLEAWMREGGAIIEDTKLSSEMHELEWKQHITGKLKITPKDAIKKKLGRSPDRYDATALSVWEPLDLQDEAPRGAASSSDDEYGVLLDPYAGADAFRSCIPANDVWPLAA